MTEDGKEIEPGDEIACPADSPPERMRARESNNLDRILQKLVDSYSEEGREKLRAAINPAELDTPPGSILEEAQALTTGDRREQYGPPDVDFGCAAEIASVLTPHKMDAKQVVLVMVAVKLSREIHKHKRDNLVDACGYLRILSELEGDE